MPTRDRSPTRSTASRKPRRSRGRCSASCRPALSASLTDLSLAYNYQDLWWAAPAGSEAGWGVNLTHQGDTIFATWFTYDLDRHAVVAVGDGTEDGGRASMAARCIGRPARPSTRCRSIRQTSSRRRSAPRRSPSPTAIPERFDYTVNGVTQTKAITRQSLRGARNRLSVVPRIGSRRAGDACATDRPPARAPRPASSTSPSSA